MARRAARLDPTIYPTEEKVGEESLQMYILEVLRPLVEKWLGSRGVVAFTGSDQFIYYQQFEPKKRVAPDIFVLPGVRPGRRIKSWKTWVDGVVPSFALEVVSSDVDKDYVEVPAAYRELGVSELIIFDPDHEPFRDRVRFQIYRTVGRRGLVRIEASNEDRVRSKVLGCFIRAVGLGEAQRLRLATGRTGDELVPTDAEEASARAEEASARAGALEREVARLRALLEGPPGSRRRRGPGPG